MPIATSTVTIIRAKGERGDTIDESYRACGQAVHKRIQKLEDKTDQLREDQWRHEKTCQHLGGKLREKVLSHKEAIENLIKDHRSMIAEPKQQLFAAQSTAKRAEEERVEQPVISLIELLAALREEVEQLRKERKEIPTGMQG